jgi:plasmid stability protein
MQYGFFMPVNLSIKNAPDDVVNRLKLRAERHRRSLQGELLVILEEASRTPGPLTPEDILSAVRGRKLLSPSEATAMIRADRDRR